MNYLPWATLCPCCLAESNFKAHIPLSLRIHRELVKSTGEGAQQNIPLYSFAFDSSFKQYIFILCSLSGLKLSQSEFLCEVSRQK